MRNYTTDSAEAMSRVVALALLADGALDHCELASLEKHELYGRLRIDAATLDQVIHEFCNDLMQCARAPNVGQIELDRELIDHLLGDIRSPELQKEALQAIFDIVYADGRLNGGEGILISQAMNLWGLERQPVGPSEIAEGQQVSPLNEHQKRWLS
jgi:uncharacterized tellurite resistance protein B-like protein